MIHWALLLHIIFYDTHTAIQGPYVIQIERQFELACIVTSVVPVYFTDTYF